MECVDAVYPAAASALSRGRRRRLGGSRLRHRTMPVTFAEIKEVDEENDDGEDARGTSVTSVTSAASVAEERRRRPDFLDERLGREFAEFRKRRAHRDNLREPDEAPASPPATAASSCSRVTSEPRPRPEPEPNEPS